MREEAQEKKRRNELREQEAKRLRTEREAKEDQAFHDDIFGRNEPENKRKDEDGEQVASENKRRRTQEEKY
eukprot:11655285-Karenia_brevis.AAC.1